MRLHESSLDPASTQVCVIAENLGKLTVDMPSELVPMPPLTFAQSLSLVTTTHAPVVASQIGATGAFVPVRTQLIVASYAKQLALYSARHSSVLVGAA